MSTGVCFATPSFLPSFLPALCCHTCDGLSSSRPHIGSLTPLHSLGSAPPSGSLCSPRSPIRSPRVRRLPCALLPSLSLRSLSTQRRVLLGHVRKTRGLMLKLTALVKWSDAGHANALRQCMALTHETDASKQRFADALDRLGRVTDYLSGTGTTPGGAPFPPGGSETAGALQDRRNRERWFLPAPAYDIPTAVDVLGSGTYPRLTLYPLSQVPRLIEDAEEEGRMGGTRDGDGGGGGDGGKVRATMVQEMEEMMRIRLMAARLPGAFNLLTIEDGVLLCGVHREFEVRLSLVPPKHFHYQAATREDPPWFLVSANAHVRSANDSELERVDDDHRPTGAGGSGEGRSEKVSAGGFKRPSDMELEKLVGDILRCKIEWSKVRQPRQQPRYI